MNKLDTFSIDLKSRIDSDNQKTAITAEGTASFEADALVKNILQPIAAYMDNYISKLKL